MKIYGDELLAVRKLDVGSEDVGFVVVEELSMKVVLEEERQLALHELDIGDASSIEEFGGRCSSEQIAVMDVKRHRVIRGLLRRAGDYEMPLGMKDNLPSGRHFSLAVDMILQQGEACSRVW